MLNGQVKNGKSIAVITRTESAGTLGAPPISLAIQRSVDRLNQAHEPKEAIVECLRSMCEVLSPLGAIATGIVVLDPSRQRLRMGAFVRGGQEVDLSGASLDRDWAVDEPPMNLPWKQIQTGDFIWGLTSDETVLVPEARAYHEAYGAQAVAYQPLRRGEVILGFVGTILESTDPPSQAQIQLISTLAGHVSLSLEMERLANAAKEEALAREREATARVREAEARRISDFLCATIGSLTKGNDLQRTIELVIRGLARELSLAHVFLFRHDPQTRTIRLELSYLEGRIRWGLSGEENPLLAQPFPDDITPGWQFMTELRQLVTPDLIPPECSHYAWPGSLEYAQRFQLSDQGHIVLFAGDQPVGSIGFGLKDGRKLKLADRPFIEGVASQAALAIRTADLAEEAKHAAIAREREAAAELRAQELARANEELRLRDRLLQAVAETTKDLLASNDFDPAMNRALQQLGEAAGLHRVKVILPGCDPLTKETFHKLTYEWWAPHLASQASHGVLRFSDDSIFDYLKVLKSGDSIWQSIDEVPCPFREPPARVRMKSMGIVPIFAGCQYAGLVAFDDCENRRSRSQAEMDALTIAARAIGAVLQRRDLEKERVEAVAKEREAAAKARAAELQKANAALTGSLGRLAVLNDLTCAPRVILLEIAKQAAAESCYWFEYDAVSNTLEATHRIQHDVLLEGPAGDEPDWMRSAFDADITPAFRFMCDTDELVVLSMRDQSPLLWPGIAAWHWQNGRTEALAYVVKAGRQPIGVLGLGFTDRVAISPDQKELIRALSRQLALATWTVRLSNRAQQDAVAAAIAAERQQIAEMRVVELAKANDSIRRTLNQLAGRSSLDGFIPQVLKEAMIAAGAEHGTLFRIRNNHISMELFMESDALIDISSDARFEIWRNPIPFDQVPAAEKKLIERKLIFSTLPDQTDDLWSPSISWHQRMGHQTVIVCPLSVGSELFGFIGLGFLSRMTFSPQRAELIQVLGQQASLAIHLSSLASLAEEAAITQERQRAAEQRASVLASANASLRRVNDRLATTPNLTSFVCHVIEELCLQVGSQLAVIFELEPGGETLRLMGSCREGKAQLAVPNVPWLKGGGRVGTDSDFWRVLHTTRDVVEFEPCGAGPQPPLPVTQGMRDRGFRRSLNFPLLVGDQVLGFVGMLFVDNQPLDIVQMELARSLSQQVSLGLKVARLAEEANRSGILAERNRIARDLHDTLAQTFTAILMQLQAAGSYSSKNPKLAAECIERSEKLAREGLREARHSVVALAAAETQHEDVSSAIRRLAEQCTTGTAAPCFVSTRGEERTLPPLIASNVVRVCREALANAQRYAKASRIDIELVYQADALQLQVADNGRGFVISEVEDVGFGLAGMRTRAERLGGSMSIHTAPNRGTTIQMRVPLPAQPTSREELRRLR